MRRLRTAKAVASRIDLTYFKRPHALRRTRFFLCAICVIGALAWWGRYASRGNALYNPGPVGSPHAMVQNNCAACHDADGKGGFFKTVSDSACLRCHDAAIHSDKQLAFVSMDQRAGGANAGAAAPADAMAHEASAAHMRSSNCTACHVEHRGHAALLGTSDAHCVQCHGNLSAHTKGQPIIDPHVSAFTAGAHPWFGRELAKSPVSNGPGSKPPELVDPTVLLFNHATHMDKDGITHNCSICHTPEAINPLAKALTDATSGSPPWLGDNEENKPSLGLASQSAYMRPVSYARNCQGCHDIRIDLPKGVSLPHERMELVRASVMALTPDQLEWLAPKPKETPTAAPGGGPGPPRRGPRRPPTPGAMIPGNPSIRLVLFGAPPPPRPGRPPTPSSGEEASKPQAPKTANDVALDTLDRLTRRLVGVDEDRKGQIKDKLESLKKEFAPSEAAPGTVPTTAPAKPAAWRVDPEIVRFYADYLVDQQCAKCHSMRKDVLPSVASITPSLMTTVATGIPQSPRRWYVHSQFDHKPHGNIACIDCHSRAEKSQKTSDVLSPNLVWTTAAGQQQSCMKCHHAPNATGLGARADCQTCHVYHDRALEGPPHTVTNISEIVGWTTKSPATRHPATRPVAVVDRGPS